MAPRSVSSASTTVSAVGVFARVLIPRSSAASAGEQQGQMVVINGSPRRKERMIGVQHLKSKIQHLKSKMKSQLRAAKRLAVKQSLERQEAASFRLVGAHRLSHDQRNSLVTNKW